MYVELPLRNISFTDTGVLEVCVEAFTSSSLKSQTDEWLRQTEMGGRECSFSWLIVGDIFLWQIISQVSLK